MRKSKKVRIMAGDSAFDVAELKSYSKEKNIALITSPNCRRGKKNTNSMFHIVGLLNKHLEYFHGFEV